MARMQKTVDKATETVQNARETVATGVEETRTTAADVLDGVGAGVRRQSNRASRATKETGGQISDVLQESADRVRGRSHGSLFGYFRRHPMRVLLFFGLMTGVVALIAIPMLGKRSQTEDEFDPYQ